MIMLYYNNMTTNKTYLEAFLSTPVPETGFTPLVKKTVATTPTPKSVDVVVSTSMTGEKVVSVHTPKGN